MITVKEMLDKIEEKKKRELEKAKTPDAYYYASVAGYLEGALIAQVDNANFEIRMLMERIAVLEEYKKLAIDHANEVEQ